MAELSSDPRSSRRDEEARHRSSHSHGHSRHHRDRRSNSPRERRGTDLPEAKERDSRRHRSPHRKHGSPSRSSRKKVASHVAVELPYSARSLTKEDLTTFEPLFADYLSLQKQKDIEDMDDREVRGRWKSFVGKWNRGELAEGWYDPEMFQRILDRGPVPTRSVDKAGLSQDGEETDEQQQQQHDSNGSDEDDYGPILPGAASGGRRAAAVGIPSRQELALRDELLEESREEDREAIREARKADRKLQKEHLEELVPRAEAGTRERKLEKRQEVNEKMRQFRDKSPGLEVGEKELMGGGDSLEDYKKAKEREHRRKSEREVRREEMERARREEIEEKRKAWQDREDKTVSMLKELAKQRFG